MLELTPELQRFSPDDLKKSAFRDRLLIQASLTASHQQYLFSPLSSKLLTNPLLLLNLNEENQYQVIGIIDSSDLETPPGSHSDRHPTYVTPVYLSDTLSGNRVLDFKCYRFYLFFQIITSQHLLTPTGKPLEEPLVMAWLDRFIKRFTDEVRAHLRVEDNWICPITYGLPALPFMHIRLGQIVGVFDYQSLLNFYTQVHPSAPDEVQPFNPAATLTPKEDFLMAGLGFYPILQTLYGSDEKASALHDSEEYQAHQKIYAFCQDNPRWTLLFGGVLNIWNVSFLENLKSTPIFAYSRIIELSGLHDATDEQFSRFLSGYLSAPTTFTSDFSLLIQAGLIRDAAHAARLLDLLPKTVQATFIELTLKEHSPLLGPSLTCAIQKYYAEHLKNGTLSPLSMVATQPKAIEVLTPELDNKKVSGLLVEWLGQLPTTPQGTVYDAYQFTLDCLELRPHLITSLLSHFLVVNHLPAIFLIFRSEHFGLRQWEDALAHVDLNTCAHLFSWIALIPAQLNVIEFLSKLPAQLPEQNFHPDLIALRQQWSLVPSSIAKAILFFLPKLPILPSTDPFVPWLTDDKVFQEMRQLYCNPDYFFERPNQQDLQARFLQGDVLVTGEIVFCEDRGAFFQLLGMPEFEYDFPKVQMFLAAIIAFNFQVAETVARLIFPMPEYPDKTVYLQSDDIIFILNKFYPQPSPQSTTFLTRLRKMLRSVDILPSEVISQINPSFSPTVISHSDTRKIAALELANQYAYLDLGPLLRRLIQCPLPILTALITSPSNESKELCAGFRRLNLASIRSFLEQHIDNLFKPEGKTWLYLLTTTWGHRDLSTPVISKVFSGAFEQFSHDQCVFLTLLGYGNHLPAPLAQCLSEIPQDVILAQLALILPGNFEPSPEDNPFWINERARAFNRETYIIRAMALLLITNPTTEPEHPYIHSLNFEAIWAGPSMLIQFLQSFSVSAQRHAATQLEKLFPTLDLSPLLHVPLHKSWLPSLRRSTHSAAVDNTRAADAVPTRRPARGFRT